MGSRRIILNLGDGFNGIMRGLGLFRILRVTMVHGEDNDLTSVAFEAWSSVFFA